MMGVAFMVYTSRAWGSGFRVYGEVKKIRA